MSEEATEMNSEEVVVEKEEVTSGQVAEEKEELNGGEVEAEEEEEEVEYVCPTEFDEMEEMKKMFVGGLDKEITDEEFKSLFSEHGEISDSIIIRKDNAKSLFGFVTFSKCDELDECLLSRPFKYKEKEIEVKRAVPKGAHDGSGHSKTTKLHVGGVPTAFEPKVLTKYLKSRHPKKYGTIDEVDFLKAKDESGNPTEKNRGFGFITVSNEDLADRIAIGETKFTLDGNAMKISKAKPKEGGPGRGGFRGGRGGGQGYGQQGGWGSDWGYSGYGAGYGYGYGSGYGYGGGYDYYGYPAYSSYGPTKNGGGRRFAPY